VHVDGFICNTIAPLFKLPYSILFATFFKRQASKDHGKREHIRELDLDFSEHFF